MVLPDARAGVALDGINHVTLSVPDVDAAVHFYADLLGCRVLATWPAGAYLLAGSVWLALVKGPAAQSQPDDYSHIAFGVSADAFRTLSDRLRDGGVEQWQDNWTEGDSLYFRDPAGHRLEIHTTSLAARVRDARARPWDGLRISPDAERLARAAPVVRDPAKPRALACAPVGVFVVVLDDEERVLLFRAPGTERYEVVSGAVEARETVEDAARREMVEEAGSEFRFRVLGSFCGCTVDYHPDLPALVSVGFVADRLGGPVEPGDDMAGAEVRWASVEEIERGEVVVGVPRDHGLCRRAVHVARVLRGLGH